MSAGLPSGAQGGRLMNKTSPESWRRIRSLLDAALELPADVRTAFLDEACGSDDGLRAELEGLLASESRAGALLERPVAEYAGSLLAEMARSARPPDPMLGRQLGSYRLLREVGRGGMGTVYLAERADGQFDQQVAIKLLRRGDTADLLQRFLAERQILASLNHPNIARLLDGGADDDGAPYLVMEYVEGEPITGYCDRRELPLERRLDLFLTMLHAIQHAHQHLVIHRDLKPANILVTEAGDVKLLDFGIAKLLNAEGAAHAPPPTGVGLWLMTPEYASPEQVQAGPITTASDVYQLGLLLHELLTGQRPYRLAGCSAAEAERLICVEEPPPPSAVQGSPAVAHARRTTPGRLRRQLREDLDGIVLQALHKRPERRYPSAEALAEDIRRYQAGLPVRARRDAFAYRASKLLRRHRWSVAASVSLIVLLVSFAVAVTVQASRLAHERDRAAQALYQSEEVTAFLIRLFEASDPMLALGDTITARELLRRGAARARELDAQPLPQARLLDVLGRIHTSLGTYEQARPLLEQALALRRAHLGANHADVAATLFNLGFLHYRLADAVSARDRYRQALAIQRDVPGKDHLDVAITLIELGRVSSDDLTTADALLREALDIRRRALGPRHPLVAQGMDVVASNLRRRGRYEEAEVIWREALALRQESLAPDDPEIARGMLHLADLLRAHRGQPEEAELLCRRALSLLRQKLGDGHPALVHGLHSLSALLAARGETAEAELLVREALALNLQVFGPDHIRTLESRVKLGLRLHEAGKLEEAESLGRETVALWDRLFGPTHPGMAGSMTDLADVVAARGGHAEAGSLYREAIAMRQQVEGADASSVGITLARLGELLRRTEDLEEADAVFERALVVLRQHFDEDHPEIQGIHERRRMGNAVPGQDPVT
jgi:eukaryotic-like serine/threonine-protein kinase